MLHEIWQVIPIVVTIMGCVYFLIGVFMILFMLIYVFIMSMMGKLMVGWEVGVVGNSFIMMILGTAILAISVLMYDSELFL